MKFVAIGTLPSSLINFRGELLKLISSNGHHVIAMASGASDEDISEVLEVADAYKDYKVARSGLNPVKDLLTLVELIRYFGNTSPDIVFAYTIKPIIWGGLAARLTGVVRFYALITGLGYAFQRGGLVRNTLAKIVILLYKVALKSSKAVIFQNPDNMQLFIDLGIVNIDKCYLVNGSGVDTQFFKKTNLTIEPKFLLVARLLSEKGIREYLTAAKIVKTKYPAAEFNLVGPADPSPDGIEISEVLEWHDKGIVRYHGATSDVRAFIDANNIFVLPSYHEGLPRTVLEAMSMGRPILTTNVPGCKETVKNGINGWLVEKANADQLAEKMIWFIKNPEMWQGMGDESHRIALKKFDVHKVNAVLTSIMEISNETSI